MKETGDSREALFIFLAEVTNKHEKHYRGKAQGVDEIRLNMLEASRYFSMLWIVSSHF